MLIKSFLLISLIKSRSKLELFDAAEAVTHPGSLPERIYKGDMRTRTYNIEELDLLLRSLI